MQLLPDTTTCGALVVRMISPCHAAQLACFYLVMYLLMPGPESSDAPGPRAVTFIPVKEITIRKRSGRAQGCLDWQPFASAGVAEYPGAWHANLASPGRRLYRASRGNEKLGGMRDT